MKMNRAPVLPSGYTPAKFQRNRIRNNGDIEAESKWERKKENNKNKLELNLSVNPTGRSPSFPEKRFLKCVEAKVICTMSSVMCWYIQSIKSRKNLGLLRSVIYFLCCVIELFIHSCSIERKQTITDHCIIILLSAWDYEQQPNLRY